MSKIKFENLPEAVEKLIQGQEEIRTLIQGLAEYSSDDEKADFILSQMTEQEQQWTQGKKWVESAIDVGYCGVAK